MEYKNKDSFQNNELFNSERERERERDSWRSMEVKTGFVNGFTYAIQT